MSAPCRIQDTPAKNPRDVLPSAWSKNLSLTRAAVLFAAALVLLGFPRKFRRKFSIVRAEPGKRRRRFVFGIRTTARKAKTASAFTTRAAASAFGPRAHKSLTSRDRIRFAVCSG
jgi:hypothetical protein